MTTQDMSEGRALLAAGAYARAVEWLAPRHHAQPDDVELCHLLGLALHLAGDPSAALAPFERALALSPGNAALRQNMVLPLLALGDHDRAIDLVQPLVAADPGNGGARANLILALISARRFAEAKPFAEAAVAADGDDAAALAQLGVILMETGQPVSAETLLRRALARTPDAEIHYNLGVLLHRAQREREAVAEYRAALALSPGHRRAANNLAASLRNLGELAEAQALLTGLIEADDHPLHRFNRACLGLLSGRWLENWAGYELRNLAMVEDPPPALPSTPRWRGEDLSGRVLLVIHEQGYGDTLQFLRLLPRLVADLGERVAKVVFACQPRLARLIASFPPFREETGRLSLVADGADWPAHHAWIPLLSLAGHLGLTPETVHHPVPYLQPEPEPLARWARWLDGQAGDGKGPGQPMRIGISFQGNPRAHGEPGRSVPLAAFAPLAEHGDRARFVSLQKGPGEDQPMPEGLMLLRPADLDPGPDGFVDTAALMAQLDLVITSDTALAHLAGALGRPVWLLLKAVPDWRWGLEGQLTDWYATMRLFRQAEPGDWTGVIAEVNRELRLLLAIGQELEGASASAGEVLDSAIRLHQAQRYGEAIALYRHGLTLGHQPERLLNLLAMACLEAGRRAPAAARQAVPFSARAVALRPAVGDHWSNFAIALDGAGQGRDGLRALRHALCFVPDHLPAQLALARRETAAGRAEAALERVGRLLAAHPGHAHALSVQAAAALALGRFDLAEAALRQACRIEPGNSAFLVQLGAVLMKRDDPQGAARTWEKALVLDPANADAWSNLGVVERKSGLAELASWFQGEGVAAQPQHAESWSNLGISLMDAGHEAQARQAFARAIEARPGYADAQMALGMAMLNEGDYAGGLPLYERRFDVEVLGIDQGKVRLPRWQGEDLSGRSILLLAEQGFGDAFQFIRYVAMVRALGATRVVIGCRRKIAGLLATMPGVDAVICEDDPVPALDCHAYLMSLPYLCGTRVETIPAFAAYLSADPDRVRRFATWLGTRPGFRVGLVWQGNPDPQVDKGRSFPLSVLAPLAAIPGLRLIALQKGAGEEQIDTVDFPVERPPEGFDAGPDAFADTAAMILNLDLVITSDTAVAHLAGALGRPTWVILKSHAEWRWLRGRSDSPWYPRTRLFRRVAGEVEDRPFEGVVQRVTAALASLVAGNRAELYHSAEPSLAVPPPADPAARLAAAIALHRAGDLAGAEAGYASLVWSAEAAPQPVRADALHMLGGAAIERLRYHRAYLLLRAAQALGLETPAFHTNLSIALRHLGRIDEAEACLRQSLERDPSPEARMTLGNLLRDTDRFDPALEAYSAAIAERPDFAKAHRGLGNALRDMGRPDEAIEALSHALQLMPGDPETRIDRAHAYLTAGRLPEGFADYEARWQGAEMTARSLSMPRWDGTPQPGKRLLIHGEQGFGDQIQFARFLRQALDRVGEIILEVREPLIGLFGLLALDRRRIHLRRQGVDAIDDADLEAPIMSLPLLLGTTLATLPPPAQFRPDPRRIAAWDGRFGQPDRPRVGLVWQGNPNARADKGRSPPLAALTPLLAVSGVQFVSLQFKDGLEQRRGLGAAADMLVPGADLGAFDETAAAIAALDLVVSSCTSTLHLAASLGLPVFALIKYAADWRWMAGRDDSPWYPTLRLFRQPVPGDWDTVATAAAAALEEWLEHRS